MKTTNTTSEVVTIRVAKTVANAIDTFAAENGVPRATAVRDAIAMAFKLDLAGDADRPLPPHDLAGATVEQLSAWFLAKRVKGARSRMYSIHDKDGAVLGWFFEECDIKAGNENAFSEKA